MIIAAALVAASALQAKTLIVYYSFTNNVRTIVSDMRSQLADADVVEVQPAEEGVDYAANGYKIGDELISAINANPGDASSYPAIKDLAVDFSKYSDVVVAAPLWWSHMAAPMQTFLFHNGAKMAGKKIGLVVSSASSSIDGVVADAKRLVPGGNFLSPNLWIRSGEVSSCHSRVASWIASTGIGSNSAVTAIDAAGASQGRVYVSGSRICADGDFSSLGVYDLSGKCLLATSAAKWVDASELAPSVYVVRLDGGSAAGAHKVVLK